MDRVQIRQILRSQFNGYRILWTFAVLGSGCSGLLGIGDLSSDSKTLAGGTAGQSASGGQSSSAAQGGITTLESGGTINAIGGDTTTFQGGIGNPWAGSTSSVTGGNGAAAGADGTQVTGGTAGDLSSGSGTLVGGTAGRTASGGVSSSAPQGGVTTFESGRTINATGGDTRTYQGGTANTWAGNSSNVTGGYGAAAGAGGTQVTGGTAGDLSSGSGTLVGGTAGQTASGGVSSSAPQGGVTTFESGGTINATGGDTTTYQGGMANTWAGNTSNVTSGHGAAAGAGGTQAVGGTASAPVGGQPGACHTTRNFDMVEGLADYFSSASSGQTAWQPALAFWSASLNAPASFDFAGNIESGVALCPDCSGAFVWTALAGSPGPVVGVNPTANTLNLRTVYTPPNSVFAHPGSNCEYAALVWKASCTGTALVEASFTGLNTTTTDVHVIVRGRSAFDANINGLDDTVGYKGNWTVAAGDQLAFIVGCGKNGNYVSDATAVVIAIQLSP